MFEYHFIGLTDGHGTFNHTGTTHDFLEVMCQIAETFTPDIAGSFAAALLHEKANELSYLRVTDWKFEHEVKLPGIDSDPNNPFPRTQKIVLNKLR